MDNTEKYLKSIDRSLKVIAAELQKQNGHKTVTKDAPIIKGKPPDERM
ncbi:hypothetical protein [Sediminibacillus massiliensis]|nr:hypothetical protein [Sediminibacillus massiliensis]